MLVKNRGMGMKVCAVVLLAADAPKATSSVKTLKTRVQRWLELDRDPRHFFETEKTKQKSTYLHDAQAKRKVSVLVSRSDGQGLM